MSEDIKKYQQLLNEPVTKKTDLTSKRVETANNLDFKPFSTKTVLNEGLFGRDDSRVKGIVLKKLIQSGYSRVEASGMINAAIRACPTCANNEKAMIAQLNKVGESTKNIKENFRFDVMAGLKNDDEYWCPECDGSAQNWPCDRCNSTGLIKKAPKIPTGNAKKQTSSSIDQLTKLASRASHNDAQIISYIVDSLRDDNIHDAEYTIDVSDWDDRNLKNTARNLTYNHDAEEGMYESTKPKTAKQKQQLEKSSKARSEANLIAINAAEKRNSEKKSKKTVKESPGNGWVSGYSPEEEKTISLEGALDTILGLVDSAIDNIEMGMTKTAKRYLEQIKKEIEEARRY